MSDILDTIDALANASVEAMNKMPEVSDDDRGRERFWSRLMA